MTTAWPVTWPVKLAACCSRCAPRAVSLLRCARRVTGSRTSSSPHAWRQLRPEDAVLSEEGRDDLGRLSADRVWIVDPLDGTREFGEPGRTDWAVHVALWERGKLTAGAVALPAQGTVLSTAEPPAPAAARGARPAGPRAGQPDQAACPAGPAGQGSPPDADARSARPGPRRPRSSRGTADAYVHSGGQYEWDSAAPVAVRGRRGAARVAARRLRTGLQPGRSFPAGYPYLLSGARCRAAGWIARSWLFCCAVALRAGECPDPRPCPTTRSLLDGRTTY